MCLKTLIFAPESRHPKTKEAWLSSSLRIRLPLEIKVGMLVELVAKPMPTMMLSSTSKNLATSFSNFKWTSKVPKKYYININYKEESFGIILTQNTFTLKKILNKKYFCNNVHFAIKVENK